jgi:hypothetical protein
VARAKQTARSEARRRNRLANRLDDAVTPNELEGDAPAVAASGASRASGGRSSGASRASTPVRPGVFASFRAAYRPANIREDLRYLPSLLVSRAFLGAVVLMLGGAAAYIAFPLYSLPAFAFQTLTVPPAMAPIFVVGFFAPRASYPLGFAVGVVDTVVIAILVLAGAFGSTPDASVVSGLGTTLFTSAVVGSTFAAAAAWYRRFLSLSSPRRAGATATSKGGARAKAGGRR